VNFWVRARQYRKGLGVILTGTDCRPATAPPPASGVYFSWLPLDPSLEQQTTHHPTYHSGKTSEFTLNFQPFFSSFVSGPFCQYMKVISLFAPPPPLSPLFNFPISISTTPMDLGAPDNRSWVKGSFSPPFRCFFIGSFFKLSEIKLPQPNRPLGLGFRCARAPLFLESFHLCNLSSSLGQILLSCQTFPLHPLPENI